jgi:hypothetical protein
MQTAVQKLTQEISIVREVGAESSDARLCFQIREKLDALFDGDARLEETHEAIKKMLFGHLESCQNCCRSFDVRVRFRRGKSSGIF